MQGETEAYSWEWGNFPQKTPVWTAFAHAERDRKGKGKERDVGAEEDYWGAVHRNGYATDDAGELYLCCSIGITDSRVS